MESIEQTMSSMMDSFQKRMAEFEAQVDELKKPVVAPTINTIVSDFSAFKAFVLKSFSMLQKQVSVLASNVDQLEMRGRRKMLMLHGVGEDDNEDTIKVVVDVIRSKLKLHNFTEGSIRRCHRMGGSRSGGSPRPILMKLGDTAVRNNVWFAKTQLKGSGITMSEFLTKSRHELFMAARHKFGVAKCWTREGCVYVIAGNNTRHRITSLGDLSNLPVPDIQKAGVSVEKTSKARRAAATKK